MGAERTLKDIHNRIIRVLREHPDGISIRGIRRELKLAGDEQQHLDRRVRDLDSSYNIRREQHGREINYVLVGQRSEPLVADPVDLTTKARILHLSGGRCQMCGRSLGEGIRLQVDHKVPREWGGPTVDENLWALCSECNQGKRNFFASITDERVQQAMLHPSVHIRLGELLKAFGNGRVPKAYLQIVAFTHDDFEKRLRELREIGWRYRVEKRRESGRVRTFFVLEHWEPWPANPAAAIREGERAKKRRDKR
ncbi:MAG: HNH endonuclease [Dehalococcoidia bacterium]|nr:HNH endonuclease [Dehalococcoidia bacterium]